MYCLESSTEIFYGSHAHCVCSHLLSRGLVTSSHTICFQCPAIKLKGAVDIKTPHVRSQIHEMGGGGGGGCALPPPPPPPPPPHTQHAPQAAAWLHCQEIHAACSGLFCCCCCFLPGNACSHKCATLFYVPSICMNMPCRWMKVKGHQYGNTLAY